MAAVSSYNAKKSTILLQYHNPARPPRPNSSDPSEICFASAAELFRFLQNAPNVTRAQGTSITVYGLKHVDLRALFTAVSSHEKLETITLAQATDISLPPAYAIPSTLKTLELMFCAQNIFEKTMNLFQKHWGPDQLKIYQVNLHGGYRFEFRHEVPFPAAWFD